MKTILLTLAILSSIFCCAQDKPKDLDSDRNGLYMWNKTVMMTTCNFLGITDPGKSDSLVLSLSGQQFRVINSNKEVAIIQILDYKKAKETTIKKITDKNKMKATDFTESPFTIYNIETENKTNSISIKSNHYGGAQRYFRIKINDLTKHATSYYRIAPSMAFGLLNLPFKARIQANKADFSGSLNINNAIGLTYGHQSWRKFKFTTVLSYGISSITLDSLSVSRNHDRLTSSNTLPALTLSIGQMITFNKVQLGIFLGIDRLSRQNQNTYGWAFNGDPWLSIGFGYSIFSDEKENKKAKPKDSNQSNSTNFKPQTERRKKKK